MMKQWMVIKLHKLLLAPALLLGLTAAPAFAQTPEPLPTDPPPPFFGQTTVYPELTLDRDLDFDYLTDFTTTLYETDLGMTRDDYARFQQAEGYIREEKLDKGLDLILLLRERYPNSLNVMLLQAHAYLRMFEPDHALVVLDDARTRLEPLEDEDQSMLWDIITLQVRAHRQLKQPAQALSFLQNAPLKTALLASGSQEDYYLMLAQLLFETGQPEEAYHHLKAMIDSGARSSETRDALQKWSPALAESFFKLGTTAYRQGQYPRAQRLALMAYSLNPEPVKYSHLIAQAQDQVKEEVRAHFDNALPTLGNAVRNMRAALADEDYNALYREYLALRDQRDVAFFMSRDYEGYLPTRMQEVLRQVEVELKARKFAI